MKNTKTFKKLNKKPRQKTGMSIRVLGAIMIGAAVLSIFFSIFELQRTIGHAHQLYALEQERQTCDKAIQQFMDGTDFLTSQVQLFVIQCQREYMDNYIEDVYIDKTRDEALRIISELNLTKDEQQAAEGAKKESDDLIQGELWTLRLIAESVGMKEADMPSEVASFHLEDEYAVLTSSQKQDTAIAYVFGPTYTLSKTIIRNNVNDFRNEIADRYGLETMTALKNTERNTYFMAASLTLFFIFLFVSIYLCTTQVITPLIAYSGQLSKVDNGKILKLEERGAAEIRQFVGAYNELSSQVEENTQRLARLGYIDYLTDVPNRASLTEYVTALIENNDSPFGMMILDIDNFKIFNDTYGHALGDKVLQQVTKAICSAQHESKGISGRLCGEEFIVVTKNADREAIGQTAERALNNVRAITGWDVKLPGVKDFHITVSAGGMIWNGETPMDFVTLLSKADSALYISKETGKDKFTFYGE